MLKRSGLFLIIFAVFLLLTQGIEYADLQEVMYEDNGFILEYSGKDRVIVKWESSDKVRYDDNFRVLVALPNKEYTVEITDFEAEIYSRQEYLETIRMKDRSLYRDGFWNHRNDFFQVRDAGWFRSVYPVGITLNPYRNVNYRDNIQEPIQFQAIINSITFTIDVKETSLPSSDYQESASFKKLHQLLFINNDYLENKLYDPRKNPAFDFDDITWSPSLDPEHRFFRTTVFRTGINRIMGYELYREWGEDFHDINPSRFYMSYKGQKIPIYVQTGPDGNFRLEDYILFYGENAELSNIYTMRREYFLGYGAGRHPRWGRIRPDRLTPVAQVPAKEVFTTRYYHARAEWEPSLNIEDGWYWLEVPQGTRRHLEFEVPDYVTRLPVRAQEDAEITFRIHLAYRQESYPQSILEDKIYVNDTLISLSEENIHNGYVEFSVPFRGVVRPRQTNRLVFQSTGNVSKNIYVDRFYVTYAIEVTDEQNYLEFETLWQRNNFRFTRPNTNFFFFNPNEEALYQFEGEEDFLYNFSYPLPSIFAENDVSDLRILSTSQSHRHDKPWSFIHIDDNIWESTDSAIHLVTYDLNSRSFVQNIELSPDMPNARIQGFINNVRREIRDLPPEYIIFVTTSGEYRGNSFMENSLRSLFAEMNIEKSLDDFFTSPFVIVFSHQDGQADGMLFTYDKPHEFKDDLFLTFNPEIERSEQNYNFVKHFPTDEELIFGDVSGFKKTSVNEIKPNRLREQGRQIDYIIITHPEFRETLQPFIEFLENDKNYSVEVADIFDIYNEFSYGQFDPAAINLYLRYTMRNSTPPLPSYVLLVGDANIDYRNFYNTQVKTYVPTYRPQNKPLADANENFYSRLSEGLLNDIILGRWPAHSRQQLRSIINKTIDYHNQRFSYDDLEWLNRLTFLIDNGYESQAENPIEQSIPGDFFVDPIYLRHFPLKDNRSYPLNERNILDRRKRSPETTEALINALNRGTSLLYYLGHGGPNIFSHQRIILGGGTAQTDLRMLDNKDRYFFLVVMSCLNGFFDFHSPPWHHSITADFLFQPEAGAIAVFAAAGKGVVFWQQELSRSLFNSLFSPYDVGIGESVIAGRTFFHLSRGNQATDDMYVYLGEPSLDSIYPELKTSIEFKNLYHSRPVDISGIIQQSNSDSYARQLEYSPLSGFNGKGKVIFYNESNQEIYRSENVPVNGGKWSTSLLLPDINPKEILIRALFVDNKGELVAIGQNKTNGYTRRDEQPDPKRSRGFLDLLTFWNRSKAVDTVEPPEEGNVDFQIREIRVSHEYLPAGDSSYVKVRIKNTSPQSFPRVLVRSYYHFPEDPDIPMDSEDINWINMRSKSSWTHFHNISLDPFEEKTLAFKLDPETVYGTCYFKVTVNENKVIEEVCYEKNVAYASLRYLMRPDLSVENITLRDIDSESSNFTIDVEIKNYGEMAAEEFFVDYKLGDNDFAPRSFIEKLPPGERKVLTVEGSADRRQGTIQVIVDPDTGESNRYTGVVFEHLEPVTRFQENNVMYVHYNLGERSLRTSREQ